MKYNPKNHHRRNAERRRRTIRLPGYDYTSSGMYFITICTHQRACLFGEIVEGEMELNELGQLVNARWQRLPFHFPNLQLDAFVVMPNHIHGILYLTSPSGRGAALDPNSDIPTDHLCSNATPNPNRSSEPGVAFGNELSHTSQNDLPNAAPLPPRLVSGSVGAILLNFKSVTTRSCNRIKRSLGTAIWQRNYYEHIIRNEESLHRIRQYIHHNPLSWQQDQLHPNNPSKW